ncbi:MAG: divalent metal cation transporter [Candidatus Brocadiia bacterium]
MADDIPISPVPDSRVEEEAAPEPREPEALEGILQKPLGHRLLVYTKLSGPGWLQSAITLGGGSLASSLFLGALAGFSLMWLQPVAMILGVIMLSAIGYVALSTGRRPFHAINEHVNPVLGWGWAIATALANMVWCLPQFSLGAASARLNLFPSLIGPQVMSETGGKLVASTAILAVCVFVIWFYDKGSQGIRIFEWVLKAMVGVVILCFFGVVIKMSVVGKLQWGNIFRGLVPNLSMLSEPARTFAEPLDATRGFRDFWKAMIVGMQRDVMISASATAVGINMTFLLPYSMLAKGWRRNARGLAIFDLSTGLFVPFLLATGCVVIASSTQFHARFHPGLVGEPYKKLLDSGETELVNAAQLPGEEAEKLRVLPPPDETLIGKYEKICDARIRKEIGEEAFASLTDERKAQLRQELPKAEKRIAAMLIKRSAFDLAASLEPLTGQVFSHYIFGIGVLGMAISSIIILMLISGFVVCEMLGLPPKGNAHRLACMLPVVGFLGPFIWTGKAAFWLAVPTSVFGMVLAPIAYWTFFLLMNSRSLLGEDMPRGLRRLRWNVLMLIAAAAITFGSVWSIWDKAGYYGLAGLAAFLILLAVVQVKRKTRPLGEAPEDRPA